MGDEDGSAVLVVAECFLQLDHEGSRRIPVLESGPILEVPETLIRVVERVADPEFDVRHFGHWIPFYHSLHATHTSPASLSHRSSTEQQVFDVECNESHQSGLALIRNQVMNPGIGNILLENVVEIFFRRKRNTQMLQQRVQLLPVRIGRKSDYRVR